MRVPSFGNKRDLSGCKHGKGQIKMKNKKPDEQAITVTWLKSKGWKVEDRPKGILMEKDDDWCVVREDGTALLIADIQYRL